MTDSLDNSRLFSIFNVAWVGDVDSKMVSA